MVDKPGHSNKQHRHGCAVHRYSAPPPRWQHLPLWKGLCKNDAAGFDLILLTLGEK
jgi:hypothetical protein